MVTTFAAMKNSKSSIMNYTKPFRRIPLIFALFLLFIYKPATAQDTTSAENSFSLSAQLRPRVEFRDGDFLPLAKGQQPAALVSERLRFTMNYSYKNILSVRISPQTVGVWGQEAMVQGAENSGNKFALFEAWTQLKLSPFWDMKLGRQVISLDDERFFGALDWAQGARAHDALSFDFHKDNFLLKSFFAYNQNYKINYNNNLNNPSGNLFNTSDAFPYKWMQTLWAGYNINKASKLSFLFTNLGFQNTIPGSLSTGTYFSQTYGANLFHTAKQWEVDLSAYYQGGRDMQNLKTSGYLFAGYLGYKANSQWKIGIGSDWLSGNDLNNPSQTDKVFNPYFHTGHKFYGFMDYFNNGSSIRGAGLGDNYLRATYAANKNLSLGVTLHQFITPHDIQTLTEKYNKDMGREADLTFGLNINPFVNLSGGYSFYLTNSTLRYLKNTPAGRGYQQWAWLSLNVTPTFFKAKW